MTRYLVATASAHTTAAACDYLDGRVEPGDEVYVLAVEEDDGGPTVDADFETARRRLGETATVRTIRRDGEPAVEIVALARRREVDEIIMGPRRDADEGFSTIGETTRTVLNKVELPVFVVPF